MASANKPIIEKFELQSGTENTMYATWKWNKDHTEEYRVVWYYSTGDGVWFIGSDSKVNIKQSAYSAPSNANAVKFKVKAISTKHTVDKKEVSHWTGSWSTEKKYNFKNNPPSTPSVPNVDIDKSNKLTATLDNIDPNINAEGIQFEVVKVGNKLSRFALRNDKIIRNHASCTVNVNAGVEYQVRCRAYRGKEYSDWTGYSSNVNTVPSAPKKIIKLVAKSETSVLFDWTNVNNATGYEVQYTTKKGYFDSSNEVQSITVESVVGHAEITGLESGQEYFFRVRAVNDKGNSKWSPIKSVIVGKKPAAPTTWSSSTTVTTGEELKLYWIHNSQDGSKITFARLELTVGGKTVSQDYDFSSESDEEKDKSHFVVIDTSLYTEGTKIEWRVRTKGVINKWSDWSIQRTVDVYATPTLQLQLTNSLGSVIDNVDSFPIYIKGIAGPDTQTPIGYHISITANGSYDTIDSIGNSKVVSKDSEIYSNYFDITNELLVELSAGNIDLENNEEYTLTCTVSMNSGLTATEKIEFGVSWIDVEYEPNAETMINKDDVSVWIRPYAEYEEQNMKWVKIENIKNETIAYGNGVYVSVPGFQETGLVRNTYYSKDGVNWRIGDTIEGTGQGLACLSFLNDKFILFGWYDVYYSYDGITWEKGGNLYTKPDDDSSHVYMQAYTSFYENGVYRVFGSQEPTRFRDPYYSVSFSSNDGITWTKDSFNKLPYDTEYKVVYGKGVYVALPYVLDPDETAYAYYSENGIDWSPVSGLSNSCKYRNSYVHTLTYENGKFIIMLNYWTNDSDNKISYNIEIFESDDGKQWNLVANLNDNVENVISEIHYCDGLFMMLSTEIVKSENSKIYSIHSTDGVNWTKDVLMDYYDDVDMESMNDKIVIIVGSNSKYSSYYTIDGVNVIKIYDFIDEYASKGYSRWAPYTKGLRFIGDKLFATGNYSGGQSPYRLYLDTGGLPDVSLSVYRREFDGTFTDLGGRNITNGSNGWVYDPHPALDYARYRIVATDKATGTVSYCDLPGLPINEKSIIIQWNEEWSYFETNNEDEMEKPPWSGSLLRLPYNIDVSDNYDIDVSLINYIGRRNPVSYYGTQIGETASWTVDIDKEDKETLYALRRLAIWMGDVYVREPSGSGYWASIKVSFSQTHRELIIPVTLDITRVEGGI